MSNWSCIAILLLCVATAPLRAQGCGCIPLLYEGFNYAPGTAMEGQVGGSGWASAWDAQATDARPGYRAGSGTLTYDSLRSNFNALVGGQYYLLMGRPLNLASTGPFAPWRTSGGLLGNPGTTLWFSMLLHKTQTNDERVWAGLHNTSIPWYHGNMGAGSDRLLVGYFDPATSMHNGLRYWTVQVRDSFYRTAVPINASAPALIVIRLTFGTSGTGIDVYIDPPLLGGSGVQPSSPAFSLQTPTPLTFRSMALYGGSSTNHMALDEIRMASDFACVAPDSSMAENVLPTAQFTATATGGVAPFTVNFDGGASFDTDGTLSQFAWTFGDGGTRTGPVVSYTFANTGLMFARLTVTDNCGSANSAVQNLLITDSGGHIRCQAAPALTRPADCQGAGGGINPGLGLGTASTLTHANGTPYAPTGGQYAGLPAGNYTLAVSGPNQCVDTFRLHVPIDSGRCPNHTPDPARMTIGMGLQGVAYWEQSRCFKDFMKFSSSTLITFNATGSSPWDTGLAGELVLDSAGYPTVVPAPTSGGPQKVRMVVSSDRHMPPGQYVWLYEGQGTFSFGGGMAVLPGSSPGRIPLNVTGTGNLWVDIQSSAAGDHVRNLRLVRAADEATYADAPFYQPFLDALCAFTPIRFMDWQGTNASALVDWEGRPRPTDRSQTMRNGVCYEHMAQLANTLGRDIWLCVPHAANDTFVVRMARFFRDALRPDVRVYLEYSNEVWNWQFTQAHWVSNNGNQDVSTPRRYADRALRVFQLWQQAWGAQAGRIRRVLGTQTANPWVAQQTLAQAQGQFDYLAPTFYFGYSGHSCVNALRAGGASTTAADILACTRTHMREGFTQLRQTYLLAQLYGKGIAHYEGGQHMTSNPTTEPFQDSLYAAQVHPGIEDLYREMLDSLRRYGGTDCATAFVLTGLRRSRYGSWGHLEHIDQDTAAQPAPKYRALRQYLSPAQEVCPPPPAPLPIALAYFDAMPQPAHNALRWRSAAEVSAAYFDIERSEDGTYFEAQGRVQARNQPSEYAWDDPEAALPHAPARHFYRLRMADTDGSAAYSDVAEVRRPAPGAGLRLYPAPAQDRLWVSAPAGDPYTTLKICTPQGQVVLRYPLPAPGGVPLHGLAPGLYLARAAGASAWFVKE